MDKESNQYFSLTLEMGLRILNLFNQDNPSMSLKGIADDLGINKTSAYRFVNTLVKLGYLRKDSQTKILKLGSKALALSYRIMRGFDFLQIIKPFIDETYTKYNVTIDSALLDGDTLVTLYRREVKNTLTFRLPMADSSLHCSALGKAALAFLPRRQMLKIIGRLPLVKKTNSTITKKKDLLADLERTRRRGYSLNNEEYIRGLIAIGAPLINVDTKQVVGVISFDFSTVQHSLTLIERKYAKVILKLAKDISGIIPME
jgi:IclR family pca regulon transcriptional regulator